jgi:hypothetical protein
MAEEDVITNFKVISLYLKKAPEYHSQYTWSLAWGSKLKPSEYKSGVSQLVNLLERMSIWDDHLLHNALTGPAFYVCCISCVIPLCFR